MKNLFIIFALAGMTVGVSAATLSMVNHHTSVVSVKGDDKGKGKKKDKKCCSDSTKCSKGGKCCKGGKSCDKKDDKK